MILKYLPFEKFKIRISPTDACFCRSGKKYLECCRNKFKSETYSDLEYHYWSHYIIRKQTFSRLAYLLSKNSSEEITKICFNEIWDNPLITHKEKILIQKNKNLTTYFLKRINMCLNLLDLDPSSKKEYNTKIKILEPHLFSLDIIILNNLQKYILGFFQITSKNNDGVSFIAQNLYTGENIKIVDYFLWNECSINFIFSACLFPFNTENYATEFVSAYFINENYSDILQNMMKNIYKPHRFKANQNFKYLLYVCLWVEMVQALRTIDNEVK